VSFDLLSVPEGYKTDLALVISPYFDREFANQLVKKMAPSRLRYVVDDGAQAEDLEDLRKACGECLEIALGASRGIFHLKVFYFEFVRLVGRQQRKRRLLFGSANATNAGFSGEINRELIANIDLAREQDSEILNYLYRVVDAIESGRGLIVEKVPSVQLQNSCSIKLPSLSILPLGPPPGFDAWLQRGRLVARFPDSPQFLNIMVKLEKALPQGDVERIFAGRRLLEKGNRNLLRYAYIDPTSHEDTEDSEGDDGTTGHWKASLCVWTQLGFWVSDTCYEAFHDRMRAKHHQDRQNRVLELKNLAADEKRKAECRQRFLDTLQDAADQLMVGDFDPSNYLRMKGNHIDETYFSEQFEKKFRIDLGLATNEDFRRRYENGYDFLRVPYFRQDTVAWTNFVQSWAETIVLEANKSRSSSLVLRAIDTVMRSFNMETKKIPVDELIKLLRDSWAETDQGDEVEIQFGDYISTYHKAYNG